MSFWLQHGYGKGTKIEDLASSNDLKAGVILGTGDEGTNALASTVDLVKSEGGEPLLDPQSYVYSSPACTTRMHDEHSLEFADMSWAAAPSVIEGHVEKVLKLNDDLGINRPIGPGPFLLSFDDRWTPASIQYARALAQYRPDGLACLAIDEKAFSSWESVAGWLDVFTTVDISGVYLLVGRSGPYPSSWNPDILANVLRAIHWLTARNGYEVIWGYSDVAGVLGSAAGATGVATGWYHSLRSFNIAKWQPRTGGRSPKPRFFSTPMLTSLEATGQARALAEDQPDPLGATPDEITSLVDVSWSLSDSWMQHLRAVSRLISDADAQGETGRLGWADTQLEASIRRADDCEVITVDPSIATALKALRTGLQTFATDERINLNG